MREMKFKAWSIAINKMIQPNDLFQVSISGQIYYQGLNITEEYILLQFTGFSDKNGIDIYEGDIIGDWTNTEDGLRQSKNQVFWYEKEVCWKLDNSFFQNKSNCQNLYEELRNYDYELLGNIYENPELIKK